jgi:hypothetical protein
MLESAIDTSEPMAHRFGKAAITSYLVTAIWTASEKVFPDCVALIVRSSISINGGH